MHFVHKKWKALAILTILITLLIYLKVSSLNDYPAWSKKTAGNDEWVNFSWVDQDLNGRHFKKSAINVYCKIKGFDNTFSFQFDLGAELTGVYENTYSSLPQFGNSEIKKLKSNLLFLNEDQYVPDLEVSFGAYTFKTEKAYVYNEMGDVLKRYSKEDTIHLGTIGRDLFKGKVLLIDYVNHRFKISNEVPKQYQSKVSRIEIDKTGKIVLPLYINGKKLKITFDTGSSLFPLITSERNVHHFASGKNIDTLEIESWGKKHAVTSKLIKHPITLANHRYKDVKVYVNHSGLGMDNTTDGMAGNALFFDQMIIIDFKNQKFGVVEVNEEVIQKSKSKSQKGLH